MEGYNAANMHTRYTCDGINKTLFSQGRKRKKVDPTVVTVIGWIIGAMKKVQYFPHRYVNKRREGREEKGGKENELCEETCPSKRVLNRKNDTHTLVFQPISPSGQAHWPVALPHNLTAWTHLKSSGGGTVKSR